MPHQPTDLGMPHPIQPSPMPLEWPKQMGRQESLTEEMSNFSMLTNAQFVP
jgi:hypothetical protein